MEGGTNVLLNDLLRTAARKFEQQVLTNDDRFMLSDLANMAALVKGPVLTSKQLWKFLGGNSRMSYDHFKKLGVITLECVSPDPISITEAMVNYTKCFEYIIF